MQVAARLETIHTSLQLCAEDVLPKYILAQIASMAQPKRAILMMRAISLIALVIPSISVRLRQDVASSISTFYWVNMVDQSEGQAFRPPSTAFSERMD